MIWLQGPMPPGLPRADMITAALVLLVELLAIGAVWALVRMHFNQKD